MPTLTDQDFLLKSVIFNDKLKWFKMISENKILKCKIIKEYAVGNEKPSSWRSLISTTYIFFMDRQSKFSYILNATHLEKSKITSRQIHSFIQEKGVRPREVDLQHVANEKTYIE